jgi:glutamyl-tRNA(Gln) amidotransferase subunit E
MEKQINYKAVGVKVGLEIHQQLDTQHKLFCKSATSMAEKEPIELVKRKLHPVASELGEIDIASAYEETRNRTFVYQYFKKENCLVELDEEPPHEINLEALDVALQIALMLNCKIPNEIHVMRKTVTDGSNTSAFQRTMLIGMNGELKFKGKKVPITYINLEEDAAPTVSEEGGTVTYRLNRLGVPLVEIGTGILEGFTAKDIEDIAFQIGMVCRSTGKVKRGIGTIRQDVNVSIRLGDRCELKGVQELNMLAKIIDGEIQRQTSLIEIKNYLRKKGVRKIPIHFENVNEILHNSKSKILRSLIDSKKIIFALRLPEFAGVLKRKVSSEKTLGRELADYVGAFGVKGILHSDEDLVKYNAVEDFARIREKIGAKEHDAVLLIGDSADGKVAELLVKKINQIIEKVEREVRGVQEDGTTKFLRPLPGAARLYPETDVIPLPVSEEMLQKMAKNLPESWMKKYDRFKSKYKLSEDLARQILRSEYLETFEKIMEKVRVDAAVVANTFTNTVVDLQKREKTDIKRIPPNIYPELFEAVGSKKIMKEAIPELLKYLSEKPGETVAEAIKELNIYVISASELNKVIDEILEQQPNLTPDKAVGHVMSKVRGRADPQQVIAAVKKKMK